MVNSMKHLSDLCEKKFNKRKLRKLFLTKKFVINVIYY